MPLPHPMPGQPAFASADARWFWRYIASSLDRLVETTHGLSVDEMNWHPSAPGTNSVHVLVVHTLANAGENILGTLCGQDVGRDREKEFGAVARSASELTDSWPAFRASLEGALAGIQADQMSGSCAHPRRGDVTGRDVLMIAARHAAEHLGLAELTRDLAVAARSKPE